MGGVADPAPKSAAAETTTDSPDGFGGASGTPAVDAGGFTPGLEAGAPEAGFGAAGHGASADPSSSQPAAFAPPDLSGTSAAASLVKEVEGLGMLMDVNLHVKIELGRTHMLVEDVLKLGEGSVVELDRLACDPVDVYVNDRLVARGEVLVLNDNFCVRVNEILADDPHRISSV